MKDGAIPQEQSAFLFANLISMEMCRSIRLLWLDVLVLLVLIITERYQLFNFFISVHFVRLIPRVMAIFTIVSPGHCFLQSYSAISTGQKMNFYLKDLFSFTKEILQKNFILCDVKFSKSVIACSKLATKVIDC